LTKDKWSVFMKSLVEHPERVSPEFEALQLDERGLQKHAVMDVLPFHLDELLKQEQGTIPSDQMAQQTLLIVLYQQDETQRPLWFTMKLESAAIL